MNFEALASIDGFIYKRVVRMHADENPITKADITVALVSQLVAAQFPQWAHLPIRPVEVDGWDNTTFRLGEDMSVRLPSAERYILQVEKEHRWLPRLAPLLPLPIPVPLVMGAPGAGYPWPWSIYRWLEGEPATIERIADLRQFAITLAHFLTALQRIDPTGGPPPGPHNFYRGGPLTVYGAETRNTIAALDGMIDTDAATEVWEAALTAHWHGLPVWVHGDVAAGNLLVKEGRLHAVIDFGSSGVGDPACDLVIAWTLLSGESREAFRATLPTDGATWARGRGWALWKALITLAEYIHSDAVKAGEARRVMKEVLAEHKHVA
jgi:aminoglycoside phosphotransferase (APT) family kinase protein